MVWLQYILKLLKVTRFLNVMHFTAVFLSFQFCCQVHTLNAERIEDRGRGKCIATIL